MSAFGNRLPFTSRNTRLRREVSRIRVIKDKAEKRREATKVVDETPTNHRWRYIAAFAFYGISIDVDDQYGENENGVDVNG